MGVFGVRDEHITCHIPFAMFMPILNHQVRRKDQERTIDHWLLLQGQNGGECVNGLRPQIHKHSSCR